MGAKWAWAGAVLAGVVGLMACSDETTESGQGGASSSTTTSSTTSSGGGSGGSGGDGGAGGGSAGGAPFTSEGDWTYAAQTSLAADDAGGIVAAWIAFYANDTTAIGYTVSRDGGVSWTAPRAIASPDDRRASSPVVAVDSSGRFALVWLGFRLDQNNPDEHIYFSLLDEADDTFAAPTIASDDGTATNLDFDKPSVTVDAVDDFLVTWADFTGAGSLAFARTSDGSSFARHTLANDATFGNLAYLCLDKALGPSAPLYIVHLSVGATLTLHRSVDGGVNWSPLAVPATDVLFQDPTCAVSNDRIWIAYAAGTGFNPPYDIPADTINVIHSANTGTTMDAPVVASDVSGDKYLFPRLIRTTDGRLAIVYYQGLPSEPVDLVVTTSSNGITWNTSPVAAAGTMTVDSTLANWLGAYVGFTNGTDAQLVTYTDNSGVTDQISFAEFAAP